MRNAAGLDEQVPSILEQMRLISFFFSSRRRHTRFDCDWCSDVCSSDLVASAQTKNQSGAEVASLLMGEMTRLSSEPVADAELTPRKAVLIGGFGRALETTEGLVGQVASLALYGLNLDEINRYITSVQAVTAAQIQQFAGARLGVKDADIVIVGDAKDFIEPLRKQFPNVEVIKRDELDLNSPTLRKSAAGAATK